LGSSDAAGRLFADIAGRAAGAGGPEAAATQLVQQYRAAGRAIPGYGHPLHKGYDPRARRLFEVSAEVGLAGQHVAIARTVEQQARPLGFVMSHAAAEAIDYDGPAPPGFVPSGGDD